MRLYSDPSALLQHIAWDLAQERGDKYGYIQADIDAAVKGNSVALAKYGLTCSEASIRADLESRGVDPRSASQAERMTAVANIVLAQRTRQIRGVPPR